MALPVPVLVDLVLVPLALLYYSSARTRYTLRTGVPVAGILPVRAGRALLTSECTTMVVPLAYY